jgi:hypothetical protein
MDKVRNTLFVRVWNSENTLPAKLRKIHETEEVGNGSANWQTNGD